MYLHIIDMISSFPNTFARPGPKAKFPMVHNKQTSHTTTCWRALLSLFSRTQSQSTQAGAPRHSTSRHQPATPAVSHAVPPCSSPPLSICAQFSDSGSSSRSNSRKAAVAAEWSATDDITRKFLRVWSQTKSNNHLKMSKIFSWEYFSFVTLDDSVLYKASLIQNSDVLISR